MRKLLFIMLGLTLCLTLGAGSALAKDYSDVRISVGGIGDLGLGALYDVRDLETRTPAWQNYLLVENTTGKWVAFHLRFRGWRKSIEVYDHIILMSPYDVFWVILERAQKGGTTSGNQVYQAGDVLISSADTETLLNSGLIYPDDLVDGKGYWLEMFQYFLLTDCGFGDPIADRAALQAEVQAGHFEIIGLWQLEVPPIYTSGEDTHVLANVVRDLWVDSSNTINLYDVLEALFYERGPAGQFNWPGWACDLVRISGMVLPNGATDTDNETGLDRYPRWAEDCGNVLTGTIEFYDTGNGQYGLENVIFIEDFRTGSSGWNPPPWYPHRDGYNGGAIVYPTSVMYWNVNYYSAATWGPFGYLHPAFYVNENWATTVGAGLRDGDDGNIGSNTGPDFNADWSLDDLEWALLKSQIWYQWFDLVTWNGAKVETAVNLTFPTKHYHYFWQDWPYYNGHSNTGVWDGVSCFRNIRPSQLGGPWGAMAVNCTIPTAPVIGFLNGLTFSGATATARAQAYVAAVNKYRGSDAEPRIDASAGVLGQCLDAAHGSIKTWFMAKWTNGPVVSEAKMWDMDENREGKTPGTPPPGSPWKPEFTNPKTIPHEVNIIIVGGGTRTGVEEATGILDEAPDWGYTEGHWVIFTPSLTNSTRYGGTGLPYGAPYNLPPIGVVVFTHSFIDGVDGIIRMAMAEWHFKTEGYYYLTRPDSAP